MAAPRPRAGFTLRELLVVVLCCGVLFGIVAYLLREARQKAQVNVCFSNQSLLSLGVLQAADHQGHYPGYANPVGERTASYALPLMPFLEHDDIYVSWADAGNAKPKVPHLAEMICPSDSYAMRNSGAVNSYVINAGQADASGDAAPALLLANGVAQNLMLPKPVLSTQDYIVGHDGTSYTLLLSENLQSGSWAESALPQLYYDTTFLWWNEPPTTTRDYRINLGRRVHPRPAEDAVYSRPSSYHPGGVVASFCDGHIRFLNEDIDYGVYRQLMTPNGAASGDSHNAPLPADF